MTPRLPVLVGLAAALVLAPAAAASADTSLPFHDPNVAGKLGFCDRHNKPVTSGSIRDVPFVWKVVSDTAAPKAYSSKLAKATLYAYSPIKNVSPGEWSPYQMTASAMFSNPAVPMVQSTYKDSPLEYHTTGFPPTLDGLVQLRVLFSAPNTVPRTTQYPAAVIRVKGDRWTLVTGDPTPNCAAGTSLSITTQRTPAKLMPTAAPAWAANAPGKTGAAGGASPAPSGGAAAAGGTAPQQAAGGATPQAEAADSVDSADSAAAPEAAGSGASTPSGGSSALPAVLLGAIAIAGAGIGGVVLGRRSRPSTSPDHSSDPSKGQS